MSIIISLLSFALFSTVQSNDAIGATIATRVVNEPGFGDLTNQYAFSMTEFKDKLYVGTLNAVGPTAIGLFFFGLPFPTNGAQIWEVKINGAGKYLFKRVENNGNNNPNNYGVRQMITVGNYIYALTGNHVDGFELWRTKNGNKWDVIISGGMGDPSNLSGRSIIDYDGYLYIGIENRQTGAKMYRREINANGDFKSGSVWEMITANGFNNNFNWWFADFAKYTIGGTEYLYVSTLNLGGFNLFRTSDGTNFDLILFQGGAAPNTPLFSGLRQNWGGFDMAVFNDKLFISTFNFVGGSALYANSAADTDGTMFEPVFEGGNGNPQNVYSWRLQVFNDRLYVGTFDSSGTFDMFSSSNGADWTTVETSTAFGNGQYGVRSMAVFKNRLIIGTADSAVENGCLLIEATPI